MGIQLSKKIRQLRGSNSAGGKALMFWCPGCDCAHVLDVEKPNSWGATWSWNGDVDKPTFSPSLNCWPNSDAHRCHSFIRDGQIQFLDDCAHKLKVRR